MNVIRFNKRKILKICFIVFSVYILKCLFDWFVSVEEPSLSYDHLQRRFYIRQNSVFFRRLNQQVYNSRDHSDFYHLDENENVRVIDSEEKDESKRPFQIKSALLPYSNILVEYWVDLIENAVNLGLNTIEIQVVWNNHEPVEKKYDFKIYSNDLEAFLKLVHNFGLHAIVQLDPYIPCSNFDFGGLPSWLLSQNDLSLNFNDRKLFTAFKNYLDKVLPIIYRNQFTRDGPIIGILIQNYDSSSQLTDKNEWLRFYDKEYAEFIKNMLQTHNIVELMLKSIGTCEYSSVDSYSSYCDSNLYVYMPVENHKIETRFFTSYAAANGTRKPSSCFGNKKKKNFFAFSIF
jgi:hypothetical protein